ncbi:ABC transporter permease [Streptomyces lunaelactis]|uniref:ABC transporter permease n=1 Tax=Streptomyces lunaelactis TaxID=1535768 RepID=UPI001584FCC6|nr:ABC transporter permease [Streptomyces lunaelactis]NUL04953.1 ABC transporter permease [Streptomyces lunaelactis]
MTRFVLLRVGAHRLLLAAALLAVLLTASVLSALAAFSGSIGDAALRHTLRTRDAASVALTVTTGHVPSDKRESADRAAERGARRTFDGLPVTVRKLASSGPYALPRTLQPPAARAGYPDLTHIAVLDRSRIRLTQGTWPAAGSAGPLQVALPETAAHQLKLKPGARLALTDRLTDDPLTVTVSGLYRAAEPTDPYWQLDSLNGRGVRKVVFTTYGPLLCDPAVLSSGRIPTSQTSWLATADFRGVGTDRIDTLRTAAGSGPKTLAADPVFAGGARATTALPVVLDRTERALLVSRSTLMIVAVQLVLLAAYALLLVSRLLSTERVGETDLLRARGGSRRRIASLAAIEALLLAVPAAVCAPLLSGPLTGLLADRSSLGDIGVGLGGSPTGSVWLVGAAVALACAAAVVAPALASAGAPRFRRGRAAALPAPVRAGADVGLLVVAAVAYWQLDRQTGASGAGALSGDREGDLGIDPLLVAAPALALLAGTVLTLRLLPPAARLAERRAAGGRGLSAALAGWQFSRRPLRGAGPVLLLVLAVAMGMLAIGQSASWERSQDDQADFRTGAAVRMIGTDISEPGRAGVFAALPGVRDAAPVHRGTMELSGGRTATVLAVDTAHAGERLLLRDDLSDEPTRKVLGAITPPKTGRPGLLLPDSARRLGLDLRLRAEGTADGTSPSGRAPKVTAVLEDRYGLSYRIVLGGLPADGRGRLLTLDLAAAGGGRGTPAGPLALTAIRLDTQQPVKSPESHRLSVGGLRSFDERGAEQPVAVPAGFGWQGELVTTGAEPEVGPVGLSPASTARTPLSVGYDTGAGLADEDGSRSAVDISVRVTAKLPRAPEPTAVATDGFLRAAGAKTGDRVVVTLAGESLDVRIVKAVRAIPATGAETPGASSNATGDALLLDLRAVNQVLAHRAGAAVTPNEWLISADPGRAGEVAAALRARPDVDPAQVLVRDEAADELLSDPLGSGSQSALTAVAVAAAALAAVGFAVSAAGSLRERTAEFAVLRALGAPRRRLARLIAAEQGLLVGIGLLVGLALGAVLTRAVVPLVVLTGQAARPVPPVLVELPAGQVAALLAGVAALPLLTVAAIALRRADPAVGLRHQGDN